MHRQALVVADEEQRRARRGAFLQQQVDEGLLAVGVKRRGRLVGPTRPGRPISARAAATRCCWPTDSCAAGRSSRSADRSRRAASRAASVAGLLPDAATRARRCGEKRQASRMLSRADSQGSRLKSWNTKPTWSARKRSRAPDDRAPSAWPATLTVPAWGRITPPTIDSSVVLPLPLGPRRKTRSPAAIVSASMARQSAAAPGQR